MALSRIEAGNHQNVDGLIITVKEFFLVRMLKRFTIAKRMIFHRKRNWMCLLFPMQDITLTMNEQRLNSIKKRKNGWFKILGMNRQSFFWTHSPVASFRDVFDPW